MAIEQEYATGSQSGNFTNDFYVEGSPDNNCATHTGGGGTLETDMVNTSIPAGNYVTQFAMQSHIIVNGSGSTVKLHVSKNNGSSYCPGHTQAHGTSGSCVNTAWQTYLVCSHSNAPATRAEANGNNIKIKVTHESSSATLYLDSLQMRLTYDTTPNIVVTSIAGSAVGTVTIDWSAINDGGNQTLKYRTMEAGGSWTTISSTIGPTVRSYEHTGRTAGKTLMYQVFENSLFNYGYALMDQAWRVPGSGIGDDLDCEDGDMIPYWTGFDDYQDTGGSVKRKSTSSPQSGSRCIDHLPVGGTRVHWGYQHLNIPVNDLNANGISVYFRINAGASGESLHLTVYYSDTTSTSTSAVTGTSWTQRSLAKSVLSAGKTISEIRLVYTASGGGTNGFADSIVIDIDYAPTTSTPSSGTIRVTKPTRSPFDGGDALTYWYVLYDKVSTFDSGDLGNSGDIAIGTSYWDHGGLTGGDTWYYKIRYKNSIGYGNYADYTSDTAVEVPDVCSAPAEPQAENVGALTVARPSVPSGNGDGPDGWRIYHNVDSYVAVQKDNAVGVTEWEFTSLGNSTTRYYKVAFYNDMGEASQSPASPAGITWNIPGFADPASAATPEASMIRITKNAVDPSDGGGTPGEPIDTWSVWRSATSGGAYSKISGDIAIGTTTYDDWSVDGGETWYYKTKYENLVGDGALSTNWVTATATKIEQSRVSDSRILKIITDLDRVSDSRIKRIGFDEQTRLSDSRILNTYEQTRDSDSRVRRTRRVPPQLTSGLIAYYPLDTNVNDYASNKHGINNGVLFVEDGMNNIGVFERGNSDYVGFSAGVAQQIPLCDQDLAISCLFKVTDVTGGVIVEKQYGEPNGWGILKTPSGDLIISVTNDADESFNLSLATNSEVIIGVLHHAVLVWDVSTKTLYGWFNEITATPLVVTGNFTSVGGDNYFNIGRRFNATLYFDGQIDEVRVYNRTLLALEARSLGSLGVSSISRIKRLGFEITRVSGSRIIHRVGLEKLSDSRIKKEALEVSRVSNSRILFEGMFPKLSDSRIKREAFADVQTPSDSRIQIPDNELTRDSDSRIAARRRVRNIPQSGLLAYYPLDYDALDYAGVNHGTNNGVTFVDGKINRAGDFDGSSYITTTNDFVQGLGDFSVVIWAKNVGSANHEVQISRVQQAGYIGWELGKATDDRWRFTISDGTYLIDRYIDFIDAGNWQVVLITFNNTTKTYSAYVDGEFIESFQNSNLTDAWYIAALKLDIGARYGTGSAKTTGQIDDAIMYSRILTLEEIQQLSSPSVLSNSRIRNTMTSLERDSDSRLKNTMPLIERDSVSRILKLDIELTRVSDSVIQKTTRMERNSDSKILRRSQVLKISNSRILLRYNTVLIDSDSRIGKIVEKTKLSDSRLKKLDTELLRISNSRITILDNEMTRLSDTRIIKSIELTTGSDSRIKNTLELTRLSNSDIQIPDNELTKDSDSRISKTFELTRTSDSTIRALRGNLEVVFVKVRRI